MKRFALATSMVVLVGGAVYACSDDPETGTNNNNPDATTNPDGNTTTDSPTGNDGNTGTDSGQDSNTPKTCPYLEDAGSKNVPDYQPQVCKECVTQRCCTQVANCFGAAPADAGQDGGNGVKTSCMLWGECAEACFLAGGGATAIEKCEIDCTAHYGQAAAQAYEAAEGCVYAAEPAGCKANCP